eukprot:487733-Rhodomonas_salina.2
MAAYNNWDPEVPRARSPDHPDPRPTLLDSGPWTVHPPYIPDTLHPANPSPFTHHPSPQPFTLHPSPFTSAWSSDPVRA